MGKASMARRKSGDISGNPPAGEERARSRKVLAGLGTLGAAIVVKMNNLAAAEINAIRPFFLGALDLFFEVQSAGRSEGTLDPSLVGTQSTLSRRSQGRDAGERHTSTLTSE